MAVLTISPKNQVTIPADILREAGLRQGDPIEFTSLPDGGIGIYRYGADADRRTLWDIATTIAAAIPGLEDIELELPPRDLSLSEVEW